MMQSERDPMEVVREFVGARYERGEWQAWRDDTRQLAEAIEELSREQAAHLAGEFLARYDNEDIAYALGQINTIVPDGYLRSTELLFGLDCSPAVCCCALAFVKRHSYISCCKGNWRNIAAIHNDASL